MTLRMDVRDAPSVQQGIEETVRRCGALHLLVNNAGITGPHEVDIDRYAVEDWQEVIATCLSGTFFGMKYGLPAIVAGGGGAVVNLSSANGVVGIAGIAPYTAAKHGVLGLTRSAALEFATRGCASTPWGRAMWIRRRWGAAGAGAGADGRFAPDGENGDAGRGGENGGFPALGRQQFHHRRVLQHRRRLYRALMENRPCGACAVTRIYVGCVRRCRSFDTAVGSGPPRWAERRCR